MKKTSLFLIVVMVSLLCQACQKPYVEIPQDQILSLKLTTDTAGLDADGQTILSFNAVVAAGKLPVAAAKNVTFTLSPNFGTFVGSAGANSFLVTADNQGNALVSVKVGTLAGSYFISAQITYNGINYKSADVSIYLNPLSFSDKLKISADNLQPVADGFSTINLTINSHFETDSTIALASNYGSFLQSAIPLSYALPLDKNGNGTTMFRVSTDAVPYLISATFKDGTTATLTINPKISYPDLLLAEPSGIMADTIGTAITINTFLRKANPLYKPSNMQLVNFEAYQLINGIKKDVGRFTGTANAISDATGNVPTVSFFADTGDINTLQPVYINVIAASGAQTTITKTIQLTIKH